MKKINRYIGVSLCIFLCACTSAPPEVNVYSYRKESLIKPLLDQFTQDTGIQVNLVTGKADVLFQRLKSEGENTPADLLLTVDAGRLYRAKQAELLQAIDSTVLTETVPVNLRDPDNQWFGLSYRARVIMYNKSKVKPEELADYEDLTDEKWRGRLCVRSSGNIYNQSLLASIIAHLGESGAAAWSEGVVKNFARPPKGNDRSQMSGAAVGECDIAIANTYYLANWLQSDKPQETEMAAQLGVLFPNQNNRGTHINISGAGVTRHAKNPANAIKLLEYLVSDKAQEWYANTNNEYPVKESINVSPTIKSWGYPFKADTLNLNELGTLNATAVKIFDLTGWK